MRKGILAVLLPFWTLVLLGFALLPVNTASAAISDGTVGSFQKISDTEGGFLGDLDNNDRFGITLKNIGDLNSDGITDIAVGAFFDDDGGTNRGAFYILFLNNFLRNN